jgi:hypothetical protein
MKNLFAAALIFAGREQVRAGYIDRSAVTKTGEQSITFK